MLVHEISLRRHSREKGGAWRKEILGPGRGGRPAASVVARQELVLGATATPAEGIESWCLENVARM